MNWHAGSRQKPVPNLPSIPTPALNTVMGMTVCSKLSVRGTTWVEWPTKISGPEAADANTQQPTMNVGTISRQVTGHHHDCRNNRSELVHALLQGSDC